MINLKDDRYIIATRKSTIMKFVPDFRNIEYYKKGELTSEILDSYKWHDREEAITFLENNMSAFCSKELSPEDFEIRSVIFNCEVR